MTRTEAVSILALLASRYPSTKLSETNIEAFADSLADYPADLASKAAEKLSRTCQWFPSLAEIITGIVEEEAGLPLPAEAWDLACSGGEMPEEVRYALAAAGGSWALKTEPRHFVRRTFFEAYVEIRKRAIDQTRDTDLPQLERAKRAALPAGRT